MNRIEVPLVRLNIVKKIGNLVRKLSSWLSKNTVFQLLLSTFLNVIGARCGFERVVLGRSGRTALRPHFFIGSMSQVADPARVVRA